MRAVIQDVRYAARLLLRSPGFTLVAAFTLALGVGANTAIFSVVHGVLLKPLPYKDPDALLRIFEELPPDTPEFPVSPATFLEYRSQTRAFEAVAAFERADLQLGGERPEPLRGMRVTAGFFALLGYQPLVGREFTREDEAPNRSGVVILSHRSGRAGSDPILRLSARRFRSRAGCSKSPACCRRACSMWAGRIDRIHTASPWTSGGPGHCRRSRSGWIACSTTSA
jgi:hypothetical protein